MSSSNRGVRVAWRCRLTNHSNGSVSDKVPSSYTSERRSAQSSRVMRASAFLVVLLTCLTACSFDVAPVVSGELSHGLSSSGGVTTSLTTSQCQAVSEWLKARADGWTRTPASYLPDLTVRLRHADSSFTDLMVLKDSVVIVVDGGQYIRSVEPNDLSRLKTLLERVP